MNLVEYKKLTPYEQEVILLLSSIKESVKQMAKILGEQDQA
jgi:hypothetical protein